MDTFLALVESAHFNWLAMLGAFLATFVIGGIWYNKAVFGKTWMQLVGLTDESIKQGSMSAIFGGTAVAMVVYIFVMTLFVGGTGLQQGLLMGLLFGLGIVAPLHATHAFFSQKPMTLLWITIGHDVLVCLVAGAMLGAR